MPDATRQDRQVIEALADPASYPERPERVTIKETHLSWVFLTGRRAYKLKKPLHYSYLDFRTADARRLNCEREVRLNRRFTRDVYEGVTAVRRMAGGVSLGPPTPDADDWLVVMRQLDERRTLESALAAGWANADALKAPVELLLGGYDCRPRPSMPAFHYVNALWRQAGADADELRRPMFGLEGARVEAIRHDIQRFLARRADTVAERVRAGRLVEGHGDLRPEHVYIDDTPRIVDCLEFNRRLRLLDPLDELACLALHSERLGAAWIRDALLTHYAELTGDEPPRGLVALYVARRGLLWAKLAIRHLERTRADAEHWRARSEAYLDIAGRAAAAAME